MSSIYPKQSQKISKRRINVKTLQNKAVDKVDYSKTKEQDTEKELQESIEQARDELEKLKQRQAEVINETNEKIENEKENWKQ